MVDWNTLSMVDRNVRGIVIRNTRGMKIRNTIGLIDSDVAGMYDETTAGMIDVYTRGRFDGNANEIQKEGLMKYRRYRQWKYKRLGRCRRIVADRGEVAQLGRNAMTSPAGNNVEKALLFFFIFEAFIRCVQCTENRKYCFAIV